MENSDDRALASPSGAPSHPDRARIAGCGPGARRLVTTAYEITCPNKAPTVLENL